MEKYKVIHNRMGLVVNPVIQNVGRLEFEDELRVAELRTPTECGRMIDINRSELFCNIKL